MKVKLKLVVNWLFYYIANLFLFLSSKKVFLLIKALMIIFYVFKRYSV